MPTFYVLSLVQEQVIEIAIDHICCLKNCIQVLPLQAFQIFIIEIHVPELLAGLDQRLEAEHGLSASTNADDHLGQRAVQLKLALLPAWAEGVYIYLFKFFFLVREYPDDFVQVHGKSVLTAAKIAILFEKSAVFRRFSDYKVR